MTPHMLRFLLLFLLLAFSLWVRTYNLTGAPPVLLEKEARIGLIAYSFIHSDISAYKNVFSQNVWSINNNTLGPLSILVTIPFIKALGLSTFSVRLPSALAGFLTVIMFFFFAKTLIEAIEKIQTDRQILRKTFILSATSLSLIFFALSPWHIQVSRIDTGINLGLFFLLLGASLSFKVVHYPKLLFIWTIPFVLSIYSDFTFFLPSIAFILVSLIFFRRIFSLRILNTLVSLLLLFLLILPILPRSLTYTSSIDDEIMALLIRNENQSAIRIAYSHDSPISKILLNNHVENLQLFLKQLTGYLEPRQVFVQFTSNKDSISPYSGLLSPLDLIFLIVGIYFFIRYNKRPFIFLLLWTISVLLPLSATSSKTDALRAILIFPPIIILLTIGYNVIQEGITRGRRAIVFVGMSIIFSYFLLRFLFLYFSTYTSVPHNYHQEYLQAFTYTMTHVEKNTHIIVTDISFGKDLYLTKLFAFPTPDPDFGYKKNSSDPTIIARYGNYSFSLKPPLRYYRKIVYIQPQVTIPKKANVLFNSSSPLQDDQITVFTVSKND